MKRIILIILSILFGIIVYSQEIKDNHEERIRIAKEIISLLENRDTINMLSYFNLYEGVPDITPNEKMSNRLRIYNKIKNDGMVFNFNNTSLKAVSFDNQIFYYMFRVYLDNSITGSSLIIDFKITRPGYMEPWDFVLNYTPNCEASKIPQLPLTIPKKL